MQVSGDRNDRTDDRIVARIGGKVANETLVDFQSVDLPVLEIRQARITRTEVVNRYLDAKIAQRTYRIAIFFPHLRRTHVENGALGHFELQILRFNAMLTQQGSNGRAKIPAQELGRRDVERNRYQRDTRLAPR